METSLYYEDVIEEYVNDDSKEDENKQIYSTALRVGKMKFYERMKESGANLNRRMQSINGSNDFRQGLKVNSNNTTKTNKGEKDKDNEQNKEKTVDEHEN